MYQFVKRILKNIVPQEFLFRNELFFRKFLIPFYKGKNDQCNICEKHWKKFIALNNGKDLLCPYCGSRGRTRRLYQLLLEKNALRGKVLHFSPSRSLYRLFKTKKGFEYFATDYENEFLADYKLDIRKTGLPDETFDSIVCYHVLEHIVEDEQAIWEMFRILKKGGRAFVQTPFKMGDIYEDFSILGEEERKKAFGQRDHVRIYSREGLKTRLEKAGFKVRVLDFEEQRKPLGLLGETVLYLQKA